MKICAQIYRDRARIYFLYFWVLFPPTHPTGPYPCCLPKMVTDKIGAPIDVELSD